MDLPEYNPRRRLCPETIVYQPIIYIYKLYRSHGVNESQPFLGIENVHLLNLDCHVHAAILYIYVNIWKYMCNIDTYTGQLIHDSSTGRFFISVHGV